MKETRINNMGGVLHIFIVAFMSTILLSSIALTQPANIQLPSARAEYLGQKDPGHSPEIFASGIISSKENREYILRFFPDGKSCIFDRYGKDYPRGVVLTSKYENGTWVEPYLNQNCCEYGSFEPGISTDGKRIFFTSAKLPTRKNNGFLNMFYVNRTETGWSKPVYFSEGIHPTISKDGTVYYSRRFKDGHHVVCRKPLNKNNYSKEYRWGKEFEMPFQESHPAISPDGDYLIFDSEGWKHDGDCKLFISFRNDDDTWTFPQNMKKVIQREASKPWVSADGQYIFFNSEGDIYWVNAEIINEFRIPVLQ